MSSKAFSSLTDQVTDLMRRDMAQGRWGELLPGRYQLADELGCSHWTIEAAIKRLSKEGLLVSQGPGRKRRIARSKQAPQLASMRINILLYESWDRKADYFLSLVSKLQGEGHHAEFSSKTMEDLGMNVNRIARHVAAVEADAWIVIAGPLEVLQWFAAQPIPSFALFGRLNEVPLPSFAVKKADALCNLVNRLVDLGHRRIVMIVREERRKPVPGRLEQIFLAHLNEKGIPTGLYNIPDWGDNPEELRMAINSLFKHTPPTALIIDQPQLFFAVMQHLASLKLSAPEDVSMACMDMSLNFDWCIPQVTYLHWDSRTAIQRILKWARNVSHGEDDFRKSATDARLVLGGTIGPAPSAQKS